ncbi:hypothetical protein GPL21_41325 [Bradyrhizobium pachyrhizi]|uniref:Uncharacterized protein n=1 Tax=Bradyrhizobium pachyrhizi TaxID=280333 RepID=A0A844T1E1_9BRAD|nr:hypothetical protein [Bradyrhizobium pachyrhizi]MVT71425.1 hypothetical protein [Bradyrhizobium pachyrhizi]
MSRTQETKKRRTRQTRCARRSLVELTAAASRAVDDGIFVLSGGTAASNPQWEHTGANTSDQTIFARQATAPSPFAAPREDELLDSDTAIEMMVAISNDDQDRASESIRAGLDIALDRATDLPETRVEGEAASKVGPILENAFLTVPKKAATECRADAVELIVQKEPSADSAGQPEPRYMRRLTDEAVRLLDDLRSGKLQNEANFILSECFREAASAFFMINQQLKRDGYAASIDPSVFIWLANITEPETRDTGTMRLEIVPNHRGRPSTYTRQVAQFIWHLVKGQGCGRQAAYRGAVTKFTVSASFAEKAYAFWEPIFERAGPRVKMLTRISDPEM